MSFRSPLWNATRCIRNHSKRSITQNVETKDTAISRVFTEEDALPAGQQDLDKLFLDLARMRIQSQVDPEAKKVHTPVGDLPLSPLMNPEYLAAKRKYAEPKPRADYSKHGKMEKQLAKNPYALALSEPVRFDPITRSLLPRFFLQGFSYVPHPETKALWMEPMSPLPQSAQETKAVAKTMHTGSALHNKEKAPSTSKPPGASSDGGRTDDSSWLPNDTGIDRPQDTLAPTAFQEIGHVGRYNSYSLAVTRDQAKGPTRRPSKKSYTLCRRDILEAIAPIIPTPPGPPKNDRPLISTAANVKRYQKLRVKWCALAVKNPAAVVYRSDMDSYVLDLMRTWTTEKLLEYAHRCSRSQKTSRSLERYEGHWDEVQTHINRGCVLWMGDCDSKLIHRPEQFETVRLAGTKYSGLLPVYDLTVLLGPENVKKMREGPGLFEKGSTFVLCKKKSIRILLELWKLQGYLAAYGENCQNRANIVT